MDAITIDIAVAMLDAWPRCFNLIDLGPKFTLSIAISMNRGNLEALGNVATVCGNAHICSVNRFLNGIRRERLQEMSGNVKYNFEETHPLVILVWFKIFEREYNLQRIHGSPRFCELTF